MVSAEKSHPACPVKSLTPFHRITQLCPVFPSWVPIGMPSFALSPFDHPRRRDRQLPATSAKGDRGGCAAFFGFLSERPSDDETGSSWFTRAGVVSIFNLLQQTPLPN